MSRPRALIDEPRYFFKTRTWCFLTALIFIAYDGTLGVAGMLNYFQHEGHFRNTDFWIFICCRVPTVVASIILIVAAIHKNPTFVETFLWTSLQSMMICFIIFLYYYGTLASDKLEALTSWVGFVLKFPLWTLVNVYHNYLKLLAKDVELLPQ